MKEKWFKEEVWHEIQKWVNRTRIRGLPHDRTGDILYDRRQIKAKKLSSMRHYVFYVDETTTTVTSLQLTSDRRTNMKHLLLLYDPFAFYVSDLNLNLQIYAEKT